jgi:hypothetical protein
MQKVMWLKLILAMEVPQQNVPAKKQCASRNPIQHDAKASEPDIIVKIQDLEQKQDTGPAELGNSKFI